MKHLIVATLHLTVLVILVLAQKDDVPKNIADSVGNSLKWTESQFYSVAEAMPEAKYNYIPLCSFQFQWERQMMCELPLGVLGASIVQRPKRIPIIG